MPAPFRHGDHPVWLATDDGRDVPAWLCAWFRWDGAWRAYVAWTTGVGMTYAQVVSAERIRPRDVKPDAR